MWFYKSKRKTAKVFSGIFSILFAFTASCGIYMQAVIPDTFYVAQGDELSFSLPVPIKASGLAAEMPPYIYSKAGNTLRVDLSTYGNVKVKQVSVQVVERKLVIPGGTPFGIKMFTEGVMVVGMSDIETHNGTTNPAKLAGVCIGDIITAVDGQNVSLNEDLAAIIARSEGKEVILSINRRGDNIAIPLKPALNADDRKFKAGVWVRDSSAGIGTMTFIDPQSGNFGGLGHGVCDIDTGELMPLSSGEITSVTITGVKKGYSGKPGELKGAFTGDKDTGILKLNGDTGVFGTVNNPPEKIYSIPLAFKHEVKTGPAQILSTISGTKSKAYNVIIEKVNYTDNSPTKNMVIRVTDPELLDKTGGIVQGMSGSPIIQDGHLVGAVTHVFVNEPARGYGIFAENMLNSMNGI